METFCGNALATYDPPTNTEMEARTLPSASYGTAANQTSIESKVDTIDTNVDSILVDTGTDIPALLNTIIGYIDTEVAAIKAVTDNLPDSGALTTINDNIVSVLADTNELQTDLVNGGRLDTIFDSILSDTDAIQTALLSSFSEETSKPSADASLGSKLGFIFNANTQKDTFNKSTGVQVLYQSDGTSSLATRTLTDDGTSLTVGALS